jgi:hypothetical protein
MKECYSLKYCNLNNNDLKDREMAVMQLEIFHSIVEKC